MPLGFEGVNAEEALRRVIQETREEGRPLRILVFPDPVSAAIGGLVARILKVSELPFELVTYPFASEVTDLKTVGINVPSNACNECIILQQSSMNASVRAKRNILIRSKCLPATAIEILSEFSIFPPEVKGKIFSVMLSQHLPRALKGELSSAEEEFADSLSNEGILTKVKTPPIINWALLPPEDALRLSIDVLLPKFFMGEPSEVSEEELNEELSKYVGRLNVTSYYVKENGFVSDAFLNAYVALTMSDFWGLEGVAVSMINVKVWGWFARDLTLVYPLLKELVATAINKGVEKMGDFRVIKADPLSVPGSVLKKILQGLKLMGKEELLLEHGGKYYLPLAIADVKTLEVYEPQSMVRGYVVLQV